MYARVVNNAIVEIGTPTYRPTYFADRWWDCRNPQERIAYMNAAGWIEVVETVRPADTETNTWNTSWQMVNDLPTRVWVERLWTAQELADRAVVQSKATLLDVTTLQARLDRLDAYDSDTEIVAALARSNTTSISTQEMNRLLKVMLRREKRLTATIALLVRLLNSELLADISDTVDNP